MKGKSNYSRFILLWAGSMISQIGGGLTSFGLGVYIFNQTGSAARMALVTLLGFLPTLLLSVPAGVLADRAAAAMRVTVGRGAALVIAVSGVLLIAVSGVSLLSGKIRSLESGAEMGQNETSPCPILR